jgi:aconitate hydratase
MTGNSFGSRAALDVAGTRYQIHRLDAVPGASDLPYSLKILLENLVRTEDGVNVTADHVRALAAWDPTAEPDTEIQFSPARVILQDLTGVPAVVDLAAMREAMRALGGDAAKINPMLSSATSSLSSTGTRSGSPSCAGARRHSTSSRWCRPAPASCTR